MKNLLFLRHAKSSWKDSDMTDIERPLSECGINDIPIMSQCIEDLNIAPDRIIYSPAERTLRTALGIAEGLKIDPSCMIRNHRLYHAFYYDVLEIIQGVKNEIDNLLLVGHNPTITNFANKFSREYIKNVPTCGLLHIQTSVESWEYFSRENAEWLGFYYPKMYK